MSDEPRFEPAMTLAVDGVGRSVVTDTQGQAWVIDVRHGTYEKLVAGPTDMSAAGEPVRMVSKMRVSDWSQL